MFHLLKALFLVTFSFAQGADTYSAKLEPLISCYNAWCGEDWRASALSVRSPERPSRGECHGSPEQTAQDGVTPIILPPDPSKNFSFVIFLNGNAYNCDIRQVARAFCKKNFSPKPCAVEDPWSFVTFAVPGRNLNLNEDLDLKITRKTENGGTSFVFNRHLGDLQTDRQRSEGRTVCRQNNSIENGKKLQDFLNHLLTEEASKEAFDLHVQKMRSAAKDARKKETTFVEAQWGESTKTRLSRETTLEWIKRMAAHLTEPYSKKSKPVDEEDIKALKELYHGQLMKCAQAKSLEPVVSNLLRELDEKSWTLFPFDFSSDATR